MALRRLTDAEAAELRAWRAAGVELRILAEAYEMSIVGVWKIIQWQTYRYPARTPKSRARRAA